VRVGGDRASWRTLLRVALAMLALGIITSFSGEPVSFIGVGLMLANALMFAGTVVLSQYVLYEMPPQTAALYVLTAMAGVVTVTWLTVGAPLDAGAVGQAVPFIAALGLTTALSRLAIFTSVKVMGSMQTAVLGITEIGVTLLLAALILDDSLTALQWLGVMLLFGSILLIRSRDIAPQAANLGNLIVANLANVQYQRIAFHRAFGKLEDDNDEKTMSRLTTAELEAIRRMMGAQLGGVDPFPIGKAGRDRQ